MEKIHLSVLRAIIRNDCSNLNNDLFNNQLRDNPLCIWFNETEDGENYFFNCNKYRNERHIFFEIARDFQPLTMNILLYGNETSDMRHFIWVYCLPKYPFRVSGSQWVFGRVRITEIMSSIYCFSMIWVYIIVLLVSKRDFNYDWNMGSGSALLVAPPRSGLKKWYNHNNFDTCTIKSRSRIFR